MTSAALPNAELDFKDWQNLAAKLARVFQRMVGQRGKRITYDDAYSEVALRWVMAKRLFNPDLGFTFATYFISSVRYWVRPYVASLKEQDQSDRALRLDAVRWTNGNDETHDEIADVSIRTPEAALNAEDARRQIAANAPLLHHFLELMRQAPPELLEELRAAAAQRRFAASLGVTCFEAAAPTALTPNVLAQMFGLNWKQKLRLKEETEEALIYVE